MSTPVDPKSLDPQAGNRPADHELLDLLGAFEDVVDHCGPSGWCFAVSRNPVTRYFASGSSGSSDSSGSSAEL
jgi:hypothetical protein